MIKEGFQMADKASLLNRGETVSIDTDTVQIFLNATVYNCSRFYISFYYIHIYHSSLFLFELLFFELLFAFVVSILYPIFHFVNTFLKFFEHFFAKFVTAWFLDILKKENFKLYYFSIPLHIFNRGVLWEKIIFIYLN